jgi:competence protein CoiA
MFAHRRRSSCTYSHAESRDHQLAKLTLREAIAARGLRTELEWELPWFERALDSVEDLPANHGGDRRADLVVWTPTNRPIAIELQHSVTTLNQLERRAFSYANVGVAQIWLAFLEVDVLATATERPGGKDGNRYIADYAAPRWQRWLHGYNFGELWFYDCAQSALWRGRFSPSRIAVLRQGGAGVPNGAQNHEPPSKRYRGLTLWGPYLLEELRIDLGYRAAAELGRYRYPAGPTAHFVTPVPTVAGRDEYLY